MRVSMCVGQYALTPYYIAGLELPVYSMEELCVCLRENAFLLDGSLMRDELVEWIDRECGLRELAGELYPLIHKKGSLSAFVTMIMEYVGFHDRSVIREVEQVLKQGAGLTAIEKRKSQIDHLVQKKKYGAAIRGYDGLLAKWTELEREGRELPAGRVRASILHNKAVALTGLMLYGYSADFFLEAYKADGNAVHYQAYLAARRMELDERAYIAFVADQTEDCEQSLELEQRLERIKAEWMQQPEYWKLQDRKEWRGSDRQRYYDDNDALTQALKNSYRSSVSE